MTLTFNQFGKWYAIRTTPGAQRMAKAIDDIPEHRRGESIVERNLREKGIDVYMPAFWKELRQHRSRRLVERRLPLLVGYSFIRFDQGRGFDVIRGIDGVNGIVRLNPDRGPDPFSEDDVRLLMVAMFDKHQQYLFDRQSALEGARHTRRRDLSSELGRLLPKGRNRTVSLQRHAQTCIDGLDAPVKAKVLGIIKSLDNLQVDGALDAYREAV